MKCEDIEQFTSNGSYKVDFGMRGLIENIDRDIETLGLQTNPDFQRGHVWTRKQQTAFVEYFLRGGKSGTTIYLNHPFWGHFRKPEEGEYGDFVLVDGLQRITAVRAFLNGEIPAFGHKIGEFEDDWMFDDYCHHKFTVCVNNLKSREEVLRWYVDMNKGGTPHTKEEIDKVLELIEQERNGQAEEEEAAKLRKVLEDAGKGGKETPPHGRILPYSDGSMKTFSFRSEDWKRATEIYLDGIWHFMKDDPALMTRRSVVILDKKKEDMVILAKTAARGLFHLYDVSMEEMQKRILDAFGKMETFKGYIEVVPGSYSSINEEEGCVLVSLDLDKFEGDYGPILRGESLEMEKEEEEEMDR